MQNSKVAIVLIGEHTKDLYKFVRWEIEQALNMQLPIIAVNLNYKKYIDHELCPPIIRKSLVMHIAYGQKIINYALNNWPQQHDNLLRQGGNGPYYYGISTYKSIYPDFMHHIYQADDAKEFYSTP